MVFMPKRCWMLVGGLFASGLLLRCQLGHLSFAGLASSDHTKQTRHLYHAGDRHGMPRCMHILREGTLFVICFGEEVNN